MIKFPIYENFHLLSKDQAVDVIYNELVPFLEKKRIYLSSYGNHTGVGSLDTVENYHQNKAIRELFDIGAVQEVFRWAQYGLLRKTKSFMSNSYGLKHEIEKLAGNTYKTNGDVIAALILSGYHARFKKRGGDMNVNCDFKVMCSQ